MHRADVKPTSFTYFPKYDVRRKTLEPPTSPSIKSNSAELVNEQLSEHSRPDNLPLALRKSSRTCVKPHPYTISSFLTFARVFPTYKTFLLALNQSSIPKTVGEALKTIHWRNAIQEEMPYLKTTPGKKWSRSPT